MSVDTSDSVLVKVFPDESPSEFLDVRSKLRLLNNQAKKCPVARYQVVAWPIFVMIKSAPTI